MALGRIGRSVVLAAAIATIWTGVRLGLAARFGIPGPVIHDEFSLLLGADTFAHGRLVNPPHPMAKFFESPFVLMHPVYASEYPPGEALVLALGQKFFGSPFYGVVAGCALTIFAIGAALSLWVPLAWSGVVTIMLAFYFLPPMLWADSYWGCLAAGGGAFVLLAVGMFRDKRPALAGWIFGLGAMILFFTRPYEGGVFTLAALFAYRKIFHSQSLRIALMSAAPIVAAGLLWTAHYDRLVTGSALELPQMCYQKQYFSFPQFWILPPPAARSYSNARVAALLGPNGVFASQAHSDPLGIMLGYDTGISLVQLVSLIGPMGFALLLLPLFWRDPRARALLMILAALLAALSLNAWHTDRYAAPGACAIAILIALSLEQAWRFRLKKFPIGRVLAIALIIFAASSSLIHLRAAVSHEPRGADRVDLIRRLKALGKPQLVFVHYPSPDWNIEREWVYNGADIDRQAVVFAHDLGPQEDARLLHYYPNRQAWLVSMEDSGYRLEPYPR